ncbi:MAG: MFS transporter [Lachnospiraceae bacterium]
MEKLVMKTEKKERLGYYSYFIGQNMIYIFVTLYLSVYFTTNLGIPAATVGVIFLIARVWDAINDPLLSVIIERSHLKGGKFKPWIKSVAILIPVLTVLNFSFTNALTAMPISIRTIYALVMYILWGMAYTISDAPAYALATVMTDQASEKNRLISYAKFAGMIGLLFSMVVSPILVDKTGNWFLVAVGISLIAFVFLNMTFMAKERVKSTQNSPTLSDILSVLFKNKYMIVIVITIVVINGFNFAMTLTPFLTEYVYHDASLTAVILGLSSVPMVIVAPLAPRLIDKFGKNKLMIVSMLATLILSVLTFLVARDSFVLFMILSVLKFLLSGPLLIITALYFTDIIEYEFYTSGRRLEAVTFSVQTFTNKAVSALAGAFPMFLLGLFGFVESTGTETVVQSTQVVNGIWLIYNLGPALGALIGLIVFVKFYDLDEAKVEAFKASK